MSSNPKDLVIYGAGGLGREILSLIKRDYADKWRVIGFIDDAPNMPHEIDGVKLLSKNILNGTKIAVVLGFADTKLKKKVFMELSSKNNIEFPNIISKAAIVNPDMRLGRGIVVTDFCSISINVVISDAVFINVGTIVGHDVLIGIYCSIMPQCAISGNVCIGDEVLIGAKSFILQNKKIGNNAQIIAGSIVCRNVGKNEIAIGNPAHILKN